MLAMAQLIHLIWSSVMWLKAGVIIGGSWKDPSSLWNFLCIGADFANLVSLCFCVKYAAKLLSIPTAKYIITDNGSYSNFLAKNFEMLYEYKN